ncbi:pyridine nucleotide transhydrogenase [Niveibacterium sp.]|uniref:pyridine nucleotide transhydrogenase n=1 Tax=Niveibacterium sp. TaxID=2017444 RepID=UPI0035B0D161
MNSALIGYTGFVGSTLRRQTVFPSLYRSSNIDDIAGRRFDFVVCAAAPAQKWLANREPDKDAAVIDGLISSLRSFDAKKFVLISTVDVFSNPVGVDELTLPTYEGLEAYGKNRLRLEEFVTSHFEDSMVVRLPGLVGPGLKKNVIYDFVHNNNVDVIDTRNVFQFYPMVNLWADIQVALSAGLKLVHLTAEPISVGKLAEDAFGMSIHQERLARPVQYDFQSVYARTFGGEGRYQYSARDTLLATRAYAQGVQASTAELVS